MADILTHSDLSWRLQLLDTVVIAAIFHNVLVKKLLFEIDR